MAGFVLRHPGREWLASPLRCFLVCYNRDKASRRAWPLLPRVRLGRDCDVWRPATLSGLCFSSARDGRVSKRGYCPLCVRQPIDQYPSLTSEILPKQNG